MFVILFTTSNGIMIDWSRSIKSQLSSRKGLPSCSNASTKERTSDWKWSWNFWYCSWCIRSSASLLPSNSRTRQAISGRTTCSRRIVVGSSKFSITPAWFLSQSISYSCIWSLGMLENALLDFCLTNRQHLNSSYKAGCWTLSVIISCRWTGRFLA